MNYKYEFVVSVRLMTYNHEAYIKDAMDSIMMQKINFPIEIVIGDDFSTDKTLEIIKTYSDIKNIHIQILERRIGDEYWRERQIRGRLYNFINILQHCKGEYVALLDGDDYWLDPYKLQKQVDFLENNADYALVYTNFTKHYVKENVFIKNVRSKQEIIEGNIYKRLLSSNYPIATCTVLFRRSFAIAYIEELFPRYFKWVMGDYPLSVYISLNSKIKYLQEETAVYRKLEKSATNTSQKNTLLLRLSIFKIRLFFLFEKKFFLYPFVKTIFFIIKNLSYSTIKILLNYKSVAPELKTNNKITLQ